MLSAPPMRSDLATTRRSLMTGTHGASAMMSVNTLPHAAVRSADFAGSDIESAAIARLSRSALQYHDQFQPPCDRAGATEDRAVEVGRIREVGDPGHATRPDHRRFAFGATGGDDVCLRQCTDFSLDADSREILLDRLGDARLRIGVGRIKHVSKPSGKAGFGEQCLGLGDVVGIAGEGLVVARHQRRQRLVGRRSHDR
jgi:hypothetical protein